MTFTNTRDQWNLGNRALLFTENYPQWGSVLEVSGACQVFLHPGDSLVIHLLDFAGKLIRRTEGCPIRLILNDGDEWYSLSGDITWDYRRYVMKPLKEPWRVDIIVLSDIEDAEGRVRMLIEGEFSCM